LHAKHGDESAASRNSFHLGTSGFVQIATKKGIYQKIYTYFFSSNNFQPLSLDTLKHFD